MGVVVVVMVMVVVVVVVMTVVVRCVEGTAARATRIIRCGIKFFFTLRHLIGSYHGTVRLSKCGETFFASSFEIKTVRAVSRFTCSRVIRFTFPGKCHATCYVLPHYAYSRANSTTTAHSLALHKYVEVYIYASSRRLESSGNAPRSESVAADTTL